MYEASTMLADIEWRPKVLVKRVLLAANAAPLADYSVVASADELIFSAQMLHSKQPVIISLKGACRAARTATWVCGARRTASCVCRATRSASCVSTAIGRGRDSL